MPDRGRSRFTTLKTNVSKVGKKVMLILQFPPSQSVGNVDE